MTHATPAPVATLLVALTACLLSAVGPAQIPEGHYVISAARALGGGFTGPGGIYVAHPRTPQNMIELTNVPTDLTRAGFGGSDLVGANCVFVHPSGVLLVGEAGLNGDTVELHRLTLQGTTVVADAPIALGTAPPAGTGELAQMVLRDANTVLVGCNYLTGAVGPANALQVARVDLTTGTVTPLHGGNGLGILNALAYDPATATIYVGCHSSGSPVTTSIHAFQPGGPLTTIVGSIPGFPTCMAVDGGGRLWVSMGGGPGNGVNSLVRIRLQPPVTVTPYVSGWETFNALCVEPTTGQLGLCGRAFQGSPQNGVHWFDVATSTVTTLASNLVSALPRGALTGIDMAPSPRRYGTPSGTGLHRWTTTPHPLALPLSGSSWRLAVDWNGTVPVFSAAFLALAPAPILPLPMPSLGFDAWIHPGSLLGSVTLTLDPLGSQSLTTVALPPGYGGTFSLYLQEVHMDAGLQLGASDAIVAPIL